MTRRSRPSRSSMAGLIYDANQSLNWITEDQNMTEVFRNSSMIGGNLVKSAELRKSTTKSTTSTNNKSSSLKRSGSSTSLANLFSDDEERDLLGIGFFTIYEAGLVISGYFGKGIVLSRNVMTGEWSGPVAVGVSGVGAGLLLGASVKNIVYLIYDYFTLKSIIGVDGGLIFGMGAGATVGTWTKETGKQTAYITSPKTLRSAGIESSVALCRGLAGVYGAVSIEAGICKSRNKMNARFYGKENLCGTDILLSGENFDIPRTSNVKGQTVSNYQARRLMERVHQKLKMLCCRDGSDRNLDDKNDNNNININGDDNDNDNGNVNGNVNGTRSGNSSNRSFNEMSEKEILALEALYANESFDDDAESKYDEEDGEKNDDLGPLIVTEPILPPNIAPNLSPVVGSSKKSQNLSPAEVEDDSPISF